MLNTSNKIETATDKLTMNNSNRKLNLNETDEHHKYVNDI